MIGAEAIQKLLSEVDLEKDKETVREELKTTNSDTKKRNW